MPGRAPIAASRSACARRSAASTPLRTPRPTSIRGSTSPTWRCRDCPTSARRSRSAATTSTIVLNNNGQTSGQITAQAAFANAVSLLNSQSGDRYLFSGRTTDTAATVPADVMLDGIGTQAGLTQLINERRQADQGVGNMGRLDRLVAAADDDRDQPRRRRFVVRAEARLGQFVADRRDRHAADRRAAGGSPSISAPSIRTMARRSSSTSIFPTAPPSRSS